MSEALSGAGLAAKVLTVSDGVVHGTREDRSGVALVERLGAEGYDVVDHRVVADGEDVRRRGAPAGHGGRVRGTRSCRPGAPASRRAT